MNVTFFMSHWGTGSNHWHRTWHDMAWGTDHYQNRQCVH
jgi:hypothetical protein